MIFNASVYADDFYKTCLKTASKINANLPMAVDVETTFISVGCAQNGIRTSFIYTYRLKHLKDYYPASIQTLKQEKINHFCTNPNMAPIRSDFDIDIDIDYVYYDSKLLYGHNKSNKKRLRIIKE